MDGGSSSRQRRLNFENANEELDKDVHDIMVSSFNGNQSFNNEEVCLPLNFKNGNEEWETDTNNMFSSFNGNEGFSFKPNNEEDCPMIGMEFDTEEDAYQFYLAHAKRVDFSIRKSKSHPDKFGNIVDRVICCSAQGERRSDKRDAYVQRARPQTRFGCGAKIKVSSRRHNGKFVVVEYVGEHNHYLSTPSKTHLHRSHRKIASAAALQIQMAADVGIPPKASHDLMAKQVGGRENLGFIPQDYRNYLRSKRTREVKSGDTGGVLEYLHKMQLNDPNFFYAIQVDEDDLITNIFWSDAKMRTDYSHFGDVVCFDTTYRKNNEGRPIALFVGVNHHKQTVIFGAALLYDESSLTFEWLFDKFTIAMQEKRPITFLTDQAAAMAKALASTWPQTHHRLCIWHIFQNAAIHLSGVFSKFKDFAKEFGACVYDYDEEEEFIDAWNKMLSKYELEDNVWLKRLFGLKEKWALVYGRQIFCADMTTTQRSESMNSVLKKYVSYKHKFLDFFNHFQRLLEDRRYNEIRADFKSNITIPSLSYPVEILKHGASVYTPEVFQCFQQEWYKSHDSILECLDDGVVAKYKISPHRKSYHHTVTFDSASGKAYCSCKKFDFAGILCSHILKVFTLKNIMKIPSENILKRWTRQAKVGFFGATETNSTSNLDPKVIQNLRYKELCGLYVQLTTKAAESEDTYKMVKDCFLKMIRMVDERLHSGKANFQQSEVTLPFEDTNEFNDASQTRDDSTRIAKGIKRKDKTTSGKRLRGGLEKSSRRKISGKKNNEPLTIATDSSPFLSSNTENWNTMQPEGICVESLSMVETHSSYPLSGHLTAQVAFTSSSQQSFVGPRISMGMTELLLAQKPPNFSSSMANNSQQINSNHYGT